MRCVGNETGEVGFPPREPPARQRKQHAGHDQRTNRNESQGVGEVAVILQEQQWIGSGLNENIQIRRHAGCATEPGCGDEFFPPADTLGKCGAEGALTDWIH